MATAAPKAQVPLFGHFGHHVVAPTAYSVPVPPVCKTVTEDLEIQSCAPRAETVCETKDVISQEISYEKRCKEVTSKHCPTAVAPLGATVVLKKREAEADPQFLYPGAGPVVHHPVTQVGQFLTASYEVSQS